MFQRLQKNSEEIVLLNDKIVGRELCYESESCIPKSLIKAMCTVTCTCDPGAIQEEVGESLEQDRLLDELQSIEKYCL